MQRTTTILLATIVAVLGLFGVAYAAHVFPDVADDNTHADSIEWADEAGVVLGYENGNFGPEDSITRGQAASMFSRYNDTLEDIAGPAGPKGDTGTTGNRGPAGEEGTDGVSNAATEKPTASIATVAPRTNGTSTATCPKATQRAVSGGYEIEGRGTSADSAANVSVLASQPSGNYDGNFDAWEVKVFNGTDYPVSVQAAVVCADVNVAPAS